MPGGPSAPTFGWWYFQLLSTDFVITAVLHLTDILGSLADGPYISVTVYDRERDIARDFRVQVQSPVTFDNEYLRVDGLIIESEERITLNLGDEHVRLQTEIHRLADRWGPASGFVMASEMRSGRASYWSVGLPLGRVNGSLVVDGQFFGVEGFAYSDRNWGTLPIQETFRAWSWITLLHRGMFAIGFLLRGDEAGTVHFSNVSREDFGNILGAIGLLARADMITSARRVVSDNDALEALCGGWPRPDMLHEMKSRIYRTHSMHAVYRRWALVGNCSAPAIVGVLETFEVKKLEATP